MEFLTTKGIAASIEKIIRTANDYIVIICPYVKIDKTYIERLLEAEKNNVSINLIFGKEDMRDFEKEKFHNFKHINIFFLNNLHAKCYLNENTALITSMNLYGYSEENNREMGIEIKRNENYELYEEIEKECQSIRDSAEIYNLSNSQNFDRDEDVFTRNQKILGYCIRCREKINYNPYKPLCNDCYQIWSQYSNSDYQERFCHECGKEIDNWFEQCISYRNPLCKNCSKFL